MAIDPYAAVSEDPYAAVPVCEDPYASDAIEDEALSFDVDAVLAAAVAAVAAPEPSLPESFSSSAREIIHADGAPARSRSPPPIRSRDPGLAREKNGSNEMDEASHRRSLTLLVDSLGRTGLKDCLANLDVALADGSIPSALMKDLETKLNADVRLINAHKRELGSVKTNS